MSVGCPEEKVVNAEVKEKRVSVPEIGRVRLEARCPYCNFASTRTKGEAKCRHFIKNKRTSSKSIYTALFKNEIVV